MSTQLSDSIDIPEETARQIITEAVQRAVLSERARLIAVDGDKPRAETANALSDTMQRVRAERYGTQTPSEQPTALLVKAMSRAAGL
jgi:hypothetical protein